MRRVEVLLACAALACSTQVTAKFTPSGAAHTPRPANCEYQVLTAAPASFVEVGTIDVEDTGYSVYTSDLAEFKKQIQARVCEAGGDAVIALANGHGQYMKATVITLTKAAGAATSN